MAEIHVQTKKHHSSPAWIWIVVVLLIAAAVVYFLTRNQPANAENTNPAPNTTSYVTVAQVVPELG